MTAFMAAMAKEWAMPCGKIFAARGGRCDHSTTDVRGAQARMSTATRTGGSDQLDADVARKREGRSIANHGTG
ncbi:hypothetical protein [Burkholderia ambifaria]|uniref:hypothetical protein n=1 Tax=Burkholderia ambifaria TaxID=152480 RepID=UPI001589FC22|nr:hypothetical protein [Burkholderia ambifaria]